MDHKYLMLPTTKNKLYQSKVYGITKHMITNNLQSIHIKNSHAISKKCFL